MFALKLEAIGDDAVQQHRLYQTAMKDAGISKECRDFVDMKPSRPWVAKISGRHAKYGLARRFLRGKKDYLHSNSIGSRGVYLYFELEDGLYEVNERKSWRKTERYFLEVKQGSPARMTKEEVLRCLDAS